MDTKINESNKSNRKELFTHGNKKVYFSHFSTAVIGASIGATIVKAIPISPSDTSKQNTDSENVKDVRSENHIKKETETDNKTKDVGKDAQTNEDKHINDHSRRVDSNDTDEPKPTDSEDNAKKSGNHTPKDSEGKHNETTNNNPKDNPEDLSQKEIDDIAENLIKDSKIDERDNIEASNPIVFTEQVPINLPNGLEAKGYIINAEGQNYILADIDGDGVFDNLLVNEGGFLHEVTVNIVGRNGEVVDTLNNYISENHLTESDIKQIVTNGDGGNVEMTDVERKQIENDDYLKDVAVVNEETNEVRKVTNEGDLLNDANTGNLAKNSESNIKGLTEEEENDLLKDILGDEKENVALEEGEIDTLIKSIEEGSEDTALNEALSSDDGGQIALNEDISGVDDMDLNGIPSIGDTDNFDI